MNLDDKYFIKLNRYDLLKKNIVEAINKENKKCILIKDSEMDNITYEFRSDYLHLKTCVKLSYEEQYVGIYHILICLSNEESIVTDFLSVFERLLFKNTEKMSANEVINLFNSIDELFKTTPEKENKELQIGLYGELLVLKHLFNLGYNIINFWHHDYFLKHDIEIDNKNRIEIKTTTKESRIHTFKHNQLARNDVNVYVISCILEVAEKGLSLRSLIEQIIDLCTDFKMINTLCVLKKKCGITDDSCGMCFNEKLAYSKIKIYNSKNIPQLTEEIPDSITHIIYDVDLSNVKSIEFDEIMDKIYNSNN